MTDAAEAWPGSPFRSTCISVTQYRSESMINGEDHNRSWNCGAEGETQGGNNNTYCQDDEISWLDWEYRDHDLLEFAIAAGGGQIGAVPGRVVRRGLAQAEFPGELVPAHLRPSRQVALTRDLVELGARLGR
jgi:hypothetical protein